MNDDKLQSFYKSHKKIHEADVSRVLMNNILAIPQNEASDALAFVSAQQIKFSLSKVFTYLVPRVSGLAFACVIGLYLGGFEQTMAADEVEYFGAEYAEVMVSDAILGAEEFSTEELAEEFNE